MINNGFLSSFLALLLASVSTSVMATPYPSSPLDTLSFETRDDYALFEQSSMAALSVNDPWEAFNRRIYHFNQRADEYVLLPLVSAYRLLLPSPIRSGFHNVFNNLGDVSNLLNSLLQGKFSPALLTTGRLLLNSTVGLLGFFDPATSLGLTRQVEDFGQTLGFYGLHSGPYLMLPLFGPSTLRDASGRVVDVSSTTQANFLNSTEVMREYPILFGLQIIDERANTAFEYGSLNSPFEYEKLRYIVQKSRELQIQD